MCQSNLLKIVSLTVKETEFISFIPVTTQQEVKNFFRLLLGEKFKDQNIDNSEKVFTSIKQLFNVSNYPAHINPSEQMYFSFDNFWKSDIDLGYDYLPLVQIFKYKVPELILAKSELMNINKYRPSDLECMPYYEFISLLTTNSISLPTRVGDLQIYKGAES